MSRRTRLTSTVLDARWRKAIRLLNDRVPPAQVWRAVAIPKRTFYDRYNQAKGYHDAVLMERAG